MSINDSTEFVPNVKSFSKIIGDHKAPMTTFTGRRPRRWLVVEDKIEKSFIPEDNPRVPDPAGIVADEKLFILNYDKDGEAGLGMLNKIQNMTQMERLIVEGWGTPSADSGFARQGMNIPTVPRLRRPEVMAQRCGLSLDQAEDLIDYFAIIDESMRLWPDFITWIVDGRADLDYFENLAGELVDDTVGINDREFESMPLYKEAADLDIEDLDDSPFNPAMDLMDARRIWDEVITAPEQSSIDIDPDDLERWLDRNTFVAEDAGHVFYTNVEFGFEEMIPVRNELHRAHIDRGFASPDLFRYQVINNEIGDRRSWISQQPNRFSTILKRTKAIQDFPSLNIAKDYVLSGKAKLTPVQGMIFWSVYHQRKQALTEMIEARLGSTARLILSRLRNAPQSKIKYIGYWLLAAQQGREPIPGPVSNQEWELIKRAYYERRY